MKVLKEGSVEAPKKWKAKVMCGKKDRYDKKGCGAVLGVTAKDLVMMYWEGTHFCHHYAAIKCPRCGKHNRVELPALVWEKFNTDEHRRKAIFDGFSDSVW